MKALNTIVILMASLLAFSYSWSQDSSSFESNVPNVNGHYFVPNGLIVNPFNNTTYTQNLGIGFSTPIEVPTVSIGGVDIQLRTSTLVYANLLFRYNQKIKDWISFYVRVGGAARVGVDPGTLLTQGVNTMVGTSIGWKIQFWRNEKHIIGGTIGLTDQNANFINVLGYIQDVLDGVENPNVSDDISVLQTEFSINYAFGISPTFGLMANAKYSFGDSFVRGTSASEFGIGAAFDANFYPQKKVPIGMSAGLAYASLPEISLTSQQSSIFYSFKFSYTGASNLILGIDFTGFESDLGIQRDATKITSKILVNSLALSMVYYFN